MQAINDQKAIDTFIQQKALNEFRMAKELCELFDNERFWLHDQLQTITATALNSLVQFNAYLKNGGKYPKTAPLVGGVYFSEGKLKIFQHVVFDAHDHAGNLDKASATFTQLLATTPNCQTIGEIVRVFAGVCEKVKDSPDALREVQTLTYIKTADQARLIGFGDFCSTLGAYRTTQYGEAAFSPRSRARCDGKNGNPTPARDGRAIDPAIAEALGLRPADKVATGNTFYLPLLPGDVVRAIDSVLGLPQGASISGTTSDTIWALETLSNFIYVGSGGNTADANLILLALAAIVSGYHHTALEVGLPMTINGYISYQPGLYTSFQSPAMAATRAGARIREILLAYENAEANRLMLITQRTATDRELTLFDKRDPDELARFRTAVTMNYGNYRKWQQLAHGPTRLPSENPSLFPRLELVGIIAL
ncbi:hypothetical protein CXB49_16800 [Chromobacterium sp. ATCC 53434]|uniref:hypothetical protein n=1 Tax=Chromobacterium sp. (strain ATCC 53434 / SC 14030) TaxID=2059672 RepID=UPI000C78D00C|nr:hypothetical protein [Chromobacterium sp. ATCC 53434]AUH52345.1 hypothetical protein CXB49_16800 [Chromobacterium sp. ATCC 53434]